MKLRRRESAGVDHGARIEPPLGSAERRPLGEILVNAGLCSEDAIARLLTRQNGDRLGEALVRYGIVEESQISWALAQQQSVPFIDLRDVKPQAEAVGVVSHQAARDLSILPIAVSGGVLEVAVADASDNDVISVLRSLPVDVVRLSVAPVSDIKTHVDKAYGEFADLGDAVAAFVSSTPSLDLREVEVIDDEDAPVIQIVNRIVTQALRSRASDVHIEPMDGTVRVRYRVDGSLKEVLALPMGLAGPLVSRLKIMAEMNIVERRRPQDGQFRMDIDERELDVRVSTTPTIWGEKVVLRLLDKTRSLFHLSDLGMPAHVYDVYSRLARSPFGMMIVAGPTGSGKTTTLYATLGEINRVDLNVMTIEDPVEYVVPTINQLQLNEQADVTFASGLKSILRQDPDVILVGEMRDTETAQIAVQSALTGHLVMSSLHATDCVAALYRLMNMGVETFAVASSIIGLVAQRLVRRSCRMCMVEYTPQPHELAFYEASGMPPKSTFWKGEGCDHCLGTGYFDRIGVYEAMLVTDEIRQAIVRDASPNEIREIAMAQGMVPLRRGGAQLVADDITTIDEIVRTVYTAESAIS